MRGAEMTVIAMSSARRATRQQVKPRDAQVVKEKQCPGKRRPDSMGDLEVLANRVVNGYLRRNPYRNG